MLDDLRKERERKLGLVRAAGIDPYPASVAWDFEIAAALKDFEKLETSAKEVSLAGRLRSIRDQGKIIFADIEDETGKIQVVLKEDALQDPAMGTFNLWQSTLDIGDFIAVRGPLFRTKKGEMSVDVRELHLAAKSLLPLPDKWEGLENEEIRLRKRYLDLIATPELRELFRKKMIFWQTIRELLKKQGYATGHFGKWHIGPVEKPGTYGIDVVGAGELHASMVSRVGPRGDVLFGLWAHGARGALHGVA